STPPRWSTNRVTVLLPVPRDESPSPSHPPFVRVGLRIVGCWPVLVPRADRPSARRGLGCRRARGGQTGPRAGEYLARYPVRFESDGDEKRPRTQAQTQREGVASHPALVRLSRQ